MTKIRTIPVLVAHPKQVKESPRQVRLFFTVFLVAMRPPTNRSTAKTGTKTIVFSLRNRTTWEKIAVADNTLIGKADTYNFSRYC